MNCKTFDPLFEAWVHFTNFIIPVLLYDFGVSTGGGILFILANRLSIALQIEGLENLPDNQGLIWIHCTNDRDFGYLFIYTYLIIKFDIISINQRFSCSKVSIWFNQKAFLSLNPTIFNIIRWVAWLMGRSSHWPSVWCSKYYIFS